LAGIATLIAGYIRIRKAELKNYM